MDRILGCRLIKILPIRKESNRADNKNPVYPVYPCKLLAELRQGLDSQAFHQFPDAVGVAGVQG